MIVCIVLLFVVIRLFLELVYPPSRIERRPRRRVFETTRRIAHRGSRIEFPENTVEAFKFAIEQQADMIELDVWYTKDKKIVVFHDGDLFRCTGVNGHVNDLAFEDLPSLRLPTTDKWLQGSHRRDAKTKEYRIPLLKDVLKLLGNDKNVLVEIKEMKDSKRIVREVYEMLKESSLIERAIWFSLKHKTNNHIRSFQRSIPKLKQIPNLPSVIDVIRVIVLYYTGLLPYCRVDFDVFGVVVIPVVPGSNHLPFHDKVSFIPKYIYRFLIHLFFSHGGLMYSPKICKHLRNRGIPTVVLGVNADNAENITHPKELSNSSVALRIARKLGMSACLSDSPAWMWTNTRNDEFTRANFK